MGSTQQEVLPAIHIGEFAWQVIQQYNTFTVLGQSSRGLFLKSDSRWLIFLTNEKFGSPFTIVLESGSFSFDIPLGEQGELSSRGLYFPQPGIFITCTPDTIWRAPHPPLHYLTKKDRLYQFDYYAMMAREKNQSRGLNAILTCLQQPGKISANKKDNFVQIICLLNKRFSDHQFPDTTQPISELLGIGGGLTPFGDDIIIGCLLSINRWKHLLAPQFDLREWNMQIVETAYQKTTTLSANLIEGAAQGKGDERLISAIDCIMCGSHDRQKIADNLFSWGDSSGVYAFIGMSIAVISL
ncbi:MAG: DUF2877 domain-containing protein [Chloroflexota bacterium]